jgi:hypothetical protein
MTKVGAGREANLEASKEPSVEDFEPLLNK